MFPDPLGGAEVATKQIEIAGVQLAELECATLKRCEIEDGFQMKTARNSVVPLRPVFLSFAPKSNRAVAFCTPLVDNPAASLSIFEDDSMNSVRFASLLLAVFMFAGLCFAQSIKEDVNKTAQDTADATKKATHKTVDATKKAAHKTKSATVHAADKTADATKDAADATKNTAVKAGDATANAAHKTGAAVKEGTKKTVDKTKEAADKTKDAVSK